MSTTLGQPEGVHTGLFMTYRDAAGNEKKEPACPECIAKFEFSEGQKSVLKKVFEFARIHEHYSVLHDQEYYGTVGGSDWNFLRYLNSFQETLERSPGIYCLSLYQVRLLRGCIHLALAAGVVSPDEQEQAVGVLGVFADFGWHLHISHCGKNDHSIKREDLAVIHKPVYVDSSNLGRAFRLPPNLSGKTMSEIREVFETETKETREFHLANLATLHDGRAPRTSVLELALSNTVSVIRSKSETWARLAKESCPYDLGTLSRMIHEQVFVIDELLVMGCRSDEARSESAEDQDLYSAIDGIRSYVDWDVCPALKQWMEKAEEAMARPIKKPAEAPF